MLGLVFIVALSQVALATPILVDFDADPLLIRHFRHCLGVSSRLLIDMEGHMKTLRVLTLALVITLFLLGYYARAVDALYYEWHVSETLLSDPSPTIQVGEPYTLDYEFDVWATVGLGDDPGYETRYASVWILSYEDGVGGHSGMSWEDLHADALLPPSSFNQTITWDFGPWTLPGTHDLRHSIVVATKQTTEQPIAYTLVEGMVRATPTVVEASVPEPSTILLIGTGLIGLAAFRGRFKKS